MVQIVDGDDRRPCGPRDEQRQTVFQHETLIRDGDGRGADARAARWGRDRVAVRERDAGAVPGAGQTPFASPRARVTKAMRDMGFSPEG